MLTSGSWSHQVLPKLERHCEGPEGHSLVVQSHATQMEPEDSRLLLFPPYLGNLTVGVNSPVSLTRTPCSAFTKTFKGTLETSKHMEQRLGKTKQASDRHKYGRDAGNTSLGI